MGDLINQLFQALQQLILPSWPDLILLVPWVLIAILILALFGVAYSWVRGSNRTRSRVPRRLAGGKPPAGVHLPGPSRLPFIAPIGAALLLFSFALPPKDATGNAVGPFNLQLFAVGLIVTFIAIGGWLWDAMREWRAVEHPAVAHALPAGANAAVAMLPAQSAALQRRRAFEVAEQLDPDAVERSYPEPPPGVHLPGPSPWPFFAPIGATVMLYGFIFSSVLIVAGLILSIIAIAGWYLDAGHEYFSTEAVGHAVPKTRDPNKVWPRRLVPIYFGVIVISLAITLAPIGLTSLNSLTPAKSSPTPQPVAAAPEIAAKDVAFSAKTLVVPAGRPFDLTFNNNDAGVPHNVQIDDSAAKAQIIFDGDVVTGVTTVVYHVPALQPGTYYFECKVHPNMNGTVNAVTEGPQSGGAPGSAGGSGAGATTPAAATQAP